MTKAPSMIKVAVILAVVFLVLGAIGYPVIYTLFGPRHAVSFVLGIVTGVLNLLLLVASGKLLIFGDPNKGKKGLLSLVLIKYLVVFGMLFGGLYVYRLPPVAMILGILMVFPAVGVTLWLPLKEDK